MKQTFHITFPAWHPLAEGWVNVQAHDAIEARKAADAMFEGCWASVYRTDVFPALMFKDGRQGHTVHADEVLSMMQPCGELAEQIEAGSP